MAITEQVATAGVSARPTGWPDEVIAYDDGSGTLKVITADLVGEVSWNYNATMTEFALEAGASISDHRIKKPLEFTLELMQSNAPINDKRWTLQTAELNVRAVQTRVLSVSLLAGSAVKSAVGAGLSSLGITSPQVPNVQTYQFAGQVERRLDLEEQLVVLWQGGWLCSVNHMGKVFTGLVLNSLRPSTSPGKPGVMTYLCTFGQPTFATVTGEAIPAPKALRAKPKGKAGAVSGSAASPKQVTLLKAGLG